MIGRTVSHYRILGKLGSGGMGDVYKAEDTRLKRTVALKLLPPELTRDEQAKARFIHEAQAASALEHHNICNVHEIDQTDDGQLFVVMACYEGETLKDKIERGPLKIDEAVGIAVQISQGLMKAHEKRIVHRDIKPSNIFITTDEVVKILDFGLAKLSGRTVLTKEGSTLGTVNYMSPEQGVGEEVDHRTDIWSLGVVLYETICGRAPFRGEYAQAVVYSIMNEEPEPLSALRTGVPIEVERIVSKALAKNPDERYQHVDEVVADLKAAHKHRNSAQVTHHAGKKRGRVAKYTIAMVGVVALLILAGIYFLADRRDMIDSLAVLPFENVDKNPELEYLCYGIADEIISSLSRLRGLKVISSASVRGYKGKQVDLGNLAQDLDVRAVLMGRLVQPGKGLSIWIELIDTKDRRQVWGEHYQRQLTELHEIQKEISREISERLRLSLTRQDKNRLVRTYTRSNQAYQAYLKGLYHWNKFTIDSFLKAIDYYKQALAVDPEYALAYTGLSNCYASLGSYHGNLDPAEVFPKAREYALKAIELDEELGEAYLSLGVIRWYYDWDWKGAERAFLQAIELNPNSALAHQHYGVFLATMGRTTEAIHEQQRALALDPLSYKTTDDLALSYVDLHDYDKAVQRLRIAIELDAALPSAHRSLGLVYYLQGLEREAIEEFRKAAELSGGQKRYLGYLGWVLGITGQGAEAEEILSKLYERPYAEGAIALVLIGLGENGRALQWLRKAYQKRSSMMILIKVDPFYDPLRSDPGFVSLLEEMDFQG